MEFFDFGQDDATNHPHQTSAHSALTSSSFPDVSDLGSLFSDVEFPSMESLGELGDMQVQRHSRMEETSLYQEANPLDRFVVMVFLEKEPSN